jgi:hypothetical protein
MIIRRGRAGFIFIPVLALTLLGIYLWHVLTGGGNVTCDFRDTGCLAKAIGAASQQHGYGTTEFSSCAQTIFPDYICTVTTHGGNITTYNVTVATDGSSWHTM